MGRPSLGERLSAMVADVRSYDSVAVVGAGLSAFGYPMTGQLPALLWQAISDTDGAAGELERRLGRAGTPKDLLGTEPKAVAIGWRLARDLPAVRAAFQSAFVELDAGREPSPAHRELARLIHDGRVQFVVSYNWDSCLERAHQGLYGTTLPEGVLAKPHGDVLDPLWPWTLPDEDGLVPQVVLDRLRELDDRPRALLVLGYSGSDQYVVDTLLDPLANRWPVYKISPSAVGTDSVPSNANDALFAITSQLLPPPGSTSWRHVVFDRTRGFQAALRGERLGPVDVEACPELPYAKTLADRLSASRFATLSGGSGTGKSVTAFHAARRLNRSGWTVVELTRPGVAGLSDVAGLSALPGPVLAVVDDAQAIDAGVLAEFEAAVDDAHAVLLVSTKRLEDHNDETVSDSRAKELIYQHCLQHLPEIEPMLVALDDRVGPGPARESAIHRLKAANASSRDPWSFMFVASGGEQRIASTLDRLAEPPAAALLLGAVAAGQLTSQDAGVAPDQVALDVASVTDEAFGPSHEIDSDRFATTAGLVVAERLIRDNGGLLRTAHIRVAQRALLELARRDDVVGAGVRAIVRSHLQSPDLPIHGKYWVLVSLVPSESLRYRWRTDWLDLDTVDSLVAQALAVGPGADRSSAAFVLSELAFARVLADQHWRSIATRLGEWISGVDSPEIYGTARLLMHLRGVQPELHGTLKAATSAARLAQALSRQGTRGSASGWADFLREIAPTYEDEARSKWTEEFAASVDIDAITTWLSRTTNESHNDEVLELIDTLAGFAPGVAAHALRACASHLRSTIEADMAHAAHGFSRWVFGSMAIVAHVAAADGLLARERRLAARATSPDHSPIHDVGASGNLDDDPLALDTGEQWEPPPDFHDLAAVALEIMADIDWAAAAGSLSDRAATEIDDLDLLLAWLGWLSTELLDRWADAVSFNWLDRVAASPPAQMSTVSVTGASGAIQVTSVEAVSGILYAMAKGDRSKARARTYLTQRLPTLTELPSRLVTEFADVAVDLAQAGGGVTLGSPVGSGWGQATASLRALFKVDPAVAEQIFAASDSTLILALQAPQQHDLRDLAEFIDLTDSISERHLDRIFAQVDHVAAEPVWRQRLLDAPEGARALLGRAAKSDDPRGEVARRLLATRQHELRGHAQRAKAATGALGGLTVI